MELVLRNKYGCITAEMGQFSARTNFVILTPGVVSSSQLPHFDKRAFNRLKNKEPHLFSEKAAVIKNLTGKIGYLIAP